MNAHRALLPAALIACMCPGSVAAAEGDYAALRQEAVERLDAFKKLTSQASDGAIAVARERVTITTAELFLQYADWDAQHPEELKAAIGAWWRVKDQAEEISQGLPERELREVLEMLDAATGELADVLQRPESRRAAPVTVSSQLELDEGYFRLDGRPVFPSSLVWMPDDRELVDAYGEIGGTHIHPPNLQPDGTARLRYEPGGPDEPMDYVFESYRELYHGGTPLGFVTGRMLAEATEPELREWPVVVITHVTVDEREALSRYLSRGGTALIVGSESLKLDEYGRPHAADIETGQGQLHRVEEAGGATVSEPVAGALRAAGALPAVSLTKSNPLGQPGCVWRTAPWGDGYLLLILNLGKGEAAIETGAQASCRDLITDSDHPSTFKMRPFDVKLLHVGARTAQA